MKGELKLSNGSDNKIIQARIVQNGRIIHFPAFPLDCEKQMEIDGEVFLFQSNGEEVMVKNSLGERRRAYGRHPAVFVKEGKEWEFWFTEDFVRPENKLFYNFCFYSIIAHVIFAIVFSLMPKAQPPPKEAVINKEKIIKLLKKMKEKKIAKRKPKPKKKIQKVARVKKKPKKKVLRRARVKKKVAQKPRKKIRKIVRKPPKVQKRKRFVKRISKKPKIARSKKPGFKLARKVVRRGPSKATLKKRAVAKLRAQARARAVRALNFLSASSGSFNIKPTSYNMKAKYSNSTKGVKVVKGGSALGQLVTDTGDGSIQTKGVRQIASGSALNAGGYAKSLNGVRGGVASSRVHRAGSINLNSGGLTLTGANIPESAIERILAKYLDDLRFCYEKALLSDSSLGGNVTMKWAIRSKGQVSDVKVVKSQLNNSGLHSCISGVLVTIRFPRPGTSRALVSYPFSFSSSVL